MKKVYEALEKVQGGAEIIEMLKEELKVYNDLDAKSRLTEKKIDKLTKEIGDLEKIKTKLEESGIDLDDLDNLKKAGTEKTGLESMVSKLQKQMETLQQTVTQERSEKEKITAQARTERLKNDFLGDVTPIFGKFGGILVDNLVTKGALKYDDNGAIVYETPEGIYGKSQALDILKKEYQENILPSGRGSGLNPPKPNAGYAPEQKDTSKMSSRELFEMGLKKDSV
jgi:predicted RNase H-like nuclease (RuvC/YqgF family)